MAVLIGGFQPTEAELRRHFARRRLVLAVAALQISASRQSKSQEARALVKVNTASDVGRLAAMATGTFFISVDH